MNNFKEITLDVLLVVLVALSLGFLIGRYCPSGVNVAIRTFFHNVYVKLNPDSQKDTKTIIIDRAMKDLEKLPQNSIFEEPVKKENNFIIFIKRVFNKDSKKEPTIHDMILH